MKRFVWDFSLFPHLRYIFFRFNAVIILSYILNLGDLSEPDLVLVFICLVNGLLLFLIIIHLLLEVCRWFGWKVLNKP